MNNLYRHILYNILLNLKKTDILTFKLISKNLNNKIGSLFWKKKLTYEYNVELDIDIPDKYKQVKNYICNKKEIYNYEKYYKYIDIIVTNYDINYLIIYGSKLGDINLVKYAIAKGGNVHTDNDASIQWASEYGYVKIVRVLINKFKPNYDLEALSENGHFISVKFVNKKWIIYCDSQLVITI